jgi:hypothetical protein
MQREFESSFKPYPATSLLHATHFYFLAIFSQLFENSACHLPLVLAHVTRSESKETTTVLIKQLHLHAMSLCAFTVLNFGLCFVVVVVAVVVVVVVVVVAVVVVVVVLLLFLLLFAVLACYPLPLKHVAASTAARFNFSFADGCFIVWTPLSHTCPCANQITSCQR